MPQQTDCPACGAPLVYTGQQDVVRCEFCGAEISVTGETGHEDFHIIAQPDPQKEVLSKPLEGVEYAAVYEDQTEPEAFVEPALGFEDMPVNQSIPEERFSGETIYPGSGSETPAFTQPVVPPASTGTGTNRWLMIGLAVILGLCAVCACSAAAITLLFRSNNFY